jgi:hypothetical protein
MAKAIYGHVGADARLAAEVARLRLRVRELEAEIARMQTSATSDDAPGIDWAGEEWLLPDEVLVPDPR